jgi:hypothetical protein
VVVGGTLEIEIDTESPPLVLLLLAASFSWIMNSETSPAIADDKPVPVITVLGALVDETMQFTTNGDPVIE